MREETGKGKERKGWGSGGIEGSKNRCYHNRNRHTIRGKELSGTTISETEVNGMKH